MVFRTLRPPPILKQRHTGMWMILPAEASVQDRLYSMSDIIKPYLHRSGWPLGDYFGYSGGCEPKNDDLRAGSTAEEKPTFNLHRHTRAFGVSVMLRAFIDRRCIKLPTNTIQCRMFALSGSPGPPSMTLLVLLIHYTLKKELY